jgi:phage baseplate assembly protein W|tara:strand:- start:354 stop:959 length:606 start_codon:yes stop_codon:yes gene_type:complete
MSRAIYQLKPINDTPDQAVGILLPMNRAADRYENSLTALSGSLQLKGQQYDQGSRGGGSVFAQSYSTEGQAISNLINLLLTDKGERLMQPDFGTEIKKSVFEQNTESLQDFLTETITRDINRWLPYIIINEVAAERDIDSHQLFIAISFKVTQSGANMVINIMADENKAVVTDVSIDTAVSLTQVGTFSAGTVGGLGGGGY